MAGIIHTVNEYAIPRGRVYFDPFDANGLTTGEIGLGNCPGFTFTADTDKAEHFSSESGLAEKDASLIVKVNRTGKLTCDNFSLSNFSLFISGSIEVASQSSGTETEDLTVKKGRIYQLGVDAGAGLPTGLRNLSALSVKKKADATPYTLDTDYAVDLVLGRLQILAGGAIADDTEITVDYTVTAKTWQRAVSGSTAEVQGALRVVADNAGGANRDWYMPKVTLTPSGDLPIIQEGTDFTSMEFGVEVLKGANLAALYVDGRPAA